MTPGQATPSPTADPYATLPSKMSEQDWRNCFGLLQLRLRELEQRIRDLDAAIETNETAIQDLSFLHFPNARHHPRVGQEDTERGDVESEIV